MLLNIIFNIFLPLFKPKKGLKFNINFKIFIFNFKVLVEYTYFS